MPGHVGGPYVRSRALLSSLDQVHRADALLAGARTTGGLERVRGVRLATTAVTVEHEPRNRHVAADGVGERVDERAGVPTRPPGGGPDGGIVMVAPGPATCRLDRGAVAARDGVHPVAVRLRCAREFDGVGAWRAVARVRRMRVARVVAGRRERRARPGNQI